jgi:hypothetical protein
MSTIGPSPDVLLLKLFNPYTEHSGPTYSDPIYFPIFCSSAGEIDKPKDLELRGGKKVPWRHFCCPELSIMGHELQ